MASMRHQSRAGQRPRSSKKRARLLREEPTNDELDALLREAEAASSQEHRVDDATLAARVSVLSLGHVRHARRARAAQEKHDAYLAKWEEAKTRRRGRVRARRRVL